jgi:hypothetical protein
MPTKKEMLSFRQYLTRINLIYAPARATLRGVGWSYPALCPSGTTHTLVISLLQAQGVSSKAAG